jgi:hypothetical protein
MPSKSKSADNQRQNLGIILGSNIQTWYSGDLSVLASKNKADENNNHGHRIIIAIVRWSMHHRTCDMHALWTKLTFWNDRSCGPVTSSRRPTKFWCHQCYRVINKFEMSSHLISLFFCCCSDSFDAMTHQSRKRVAGYVLSWAWFFSFNLFRSKMTLASSGSISSSPKNYIIHRRLPLLFRSSSSKWVSNPNDESIVSKHNKLHYSSLIVFRHVASRSKSFHKNTTGYYRVLIFLVDPRV